MKYKQREHTTTGRRDIYPEIDRYIPEALRIANAIYPDISIPDYNSKWNLIYLEAMNKMLVKDGLRVL